MRSQNMFNQIAPGRPRHWKSTSIVLLLVLVATSAFAVQDSPAVMAVTPKHAHKAPVQDQESPAAKPPDLGEYGPVVAEFARVATKIQQGVQLPAPRTQSKILSLLPASTSVYFSIANFGEALYQADQIFNQELHESNVLNEWWQNKVGVAGMMVEPVVDQIHQLYGYLGDEIVVSGSIKAKGPSLVIVAEIKKPGLRPFLQQLLSQYGGANPPVRILSPQQLLTAKAPASGSQLQMLVRPDFLVVTSDLSTLRSVNAQMNGGARPFASSPFGQRLAQAYQGGVSMMLAADLEQLMALRPQGQPQVDAILEKTGFKDVKYLVMDGKLGGANSSSNVELTFGGPRQGIAGWLAAPTNLSGLDFVSPKAVYAGAVALANPGQMFDDIKAIAEGVNPMASAGLAQVETDLGINLRQDLLAKFAGQFAFAVEGTDASTPAWKVIAQVSDPDGLQNTFKQLVEATNEKAAPGKGATLKQMTEDGLSYSSVDFFGKKHEEIGYTFTDGYLIVASSPALLKEAMEIHRNGNSLAKSSDFRKLLPQGHSGLASAVVFQNTAQTLSAMAKTMPPEVAQLLQSFGGQNEFTMMAAYGEDRAIRMTSNSQQFNVLVPLLVAAVAIPNLIHSKTEAHNSGAAATVRTLNTAQAVYMSTYAAKGYAPDLATLGPGPSGNCSDSGSTSHACLIDSKLGCTSGAWCTKNDFQFSVSCDKENCQEYVVVGTPSDPSKGDKSFCSTSDMVVRSKPGPPLTEPITPAECQTWNPI